MHLCMSGNENISHTYVQVIFNVKFAGIIIDSLLVIVCTGADARGNIHLSSL